MRALVVLGLVGALAGAASAQSTAFGVEGPQQPAVRDAWKAWFGPRGWTPAPLELVTACTGSAPTCAAQIVALNVDNTWLVRIGANGDAVTARVYDNRGALIATRDRPCPACKPAKLAAEVTTALVELHEEVEIYEQRRATALVLELVPAEASVVLDGVVVRGPRVEETVTPGSHRIETDPGSCLEIEPLTIDVALGQRVSRQITAKLRPATLRVVTAPDATIAVDGTPIATTSVAIGEGRHEVTVSAPGRATVRESIAIAGCRPMTLQVDLGRPRRSKLPYLVGGAGVGLVAIGVTLIVLDRDQVVDGNRAATYRSSAPWGVGVGLAGVAAIGTAAVLWYLPGPVVVTPEPGGATVGMAGTF